MPYGIKDETKKQTKWMDNCVGGITGTNKRTNKPYTKSEKVAICKTQLKKQGWEASELSVSEESLRDQFYQLEDKLRQALNPMCDTVVPTPVEGVYISDIFDDYVIVEKGMELYKVSYTIDGDDVTFDWENSVKVDKVTSYEPAKEESEREVITKVPNVGNKGTQRRITWGPTTI